MSKMAQNIILICRFKFAQNWLGPSVYGFWALVIQSLELHVPYLQNEKKRKNLPKNQK